MNVRQDPSISDSHTPQELTQLLIIPHRKLNMPRNNPVLLVISCGIPGKFQNLNTKYQISPEIPKNKQK